MIWQLATQLRRRCVDKLSEGIEVTNPQSHRFVISPNVCSTTDKDGTTVLDIERDAIYSIIGLGSSIWTKLTDSTEPSTIEAIVRQISDEFRDAAPDQVSRDVERLLSGLLAKGIVRAIGARRDGPSRRGPRRFPAAFILVDRWAAAVLVRLRLHALAALCGIAAFALTLRAAGFAAMFEAVKSWPVGSRRADVDAEQRICAAVDTATTWFPKQALCLHRSAVTACLLRLHGVEAQMVVGCRKIPFKAHAWVEVEGKVVNDKRQVQQFYQVLARC
jgi:hypothetical protein